eukprot:scaffold26289_cov73-Isochrysis_galbana.AAC.1
MDLDASVEGEGEEEEASAAEEEEDASEVGEEDEGEEEEADDEVVSLGPGHNILDPDDDDLEHRHVLDLEADEVARAFADHEASAVAQRFAQAEAEAMAHDTSRSPSSTPEYLGGEEHGGAEGGLAMLFRLHAPHTQCSMPGEPGKDDLPSEIGGEMEMDIASSGGDIGMPLGG